MGTYIKLILFVFFCPGHYIKLNPYRVRVLNDVKMHFNVMQAYIYCRCVIEQPTIYLKSNREPLKLGISR